MYIKLTEARTVYDKESRRVRLERGRELEANVLKIDFIESAGDGEGTILTFGYRQLHVMEEIGDVRRRIDEAMK